MPRVAAILLAALAAAAVATVALGVLTNPQLVSVADDEAPGDGPAQGAAVSADGGRVAFTSAEPLAGPATGGVRQLYVRDRASGRTLLASASAAGQPAADPVDDPADHRAYAISGDGRYVVFASAASNLAPDGGDGAALDVFRKDLETGAVALVSRAPDGAPLSAGAGDPDISYDGSRVVFETAASIVVRDLFNGTHELASLSAGGAMLTGTIRRAAISADGGSVAFEDDGAVVARDLDARTTQPVAPGDDPDISGDGRFVAVASGGGVSRRDLSTGSTVAVASPASSPSITADGARVAFESPAALAGGDANGVADVYAWRQGVGVERVSERASGTGTSAPATRPAIGGGGSVAFSLDDSAGGSLASGDANGWPDVLAAALTPTDAAGPAIVVTEPPQGASIGAPAVTVTGAASDPSGVVGVDAAGVRARRSGSGAFSVEIGLVPGANVVTVRAVDGAGNASERTLTLTRPGAELPLPAAKARARRLRVIRLGPRTLVGFRLDPGATRVTARLWRRVRRPGRAPGWAPAGTLRRLGVVPGARRAVVSRVRLRPNVYQVRVAVVSAGGVSVASVRYQAPRPRRAR